MNCQDAEDAEDKGIYVHLCHRRINKKTRPQTLFAAAFPMVMCEGWEKQKGRKPGLACGRELHLMFQHSHLPAQNKPLKKQVAKQC